jgi:hypothetical protein
LEKEKEVIRNDILKEIKSLYHLSQLNLIKAVVKMCEKEKIGLPIKTGDWKQTDYEFHFEKEIYCNSILNTIIKELNESIQ